jgi:hypothetical protein
MHVRTRTRTPPHTHTGMQPRSHALKRMPQDTSTASPAVQNVDDGAAGSTWLPKSPILANTFAANTASPGPACAGTVPPAMPHASVTGADPGARQGLNAYESLTLPSVAFRFMVHAYLGSVDVTTLSLHRLWSL